jgi:hypothetical protein
MAIGIALLVSLAGIGALTALVAVKARRAQAKRAYYQAKENFEGVASPPARHLIDALEQLQKKAGRELDLQFDPSA